MNNVLQSDVFFFISSMSVVFITIFLIVAMVYVVAILREVRGFLHTLRSGTDALAEDISQVRQKLNEKGIWTGIVLSVMSAITGYAMRKEGVKKKTTKKVV